MNDEPLRIGDDVIVEGCTGRRFVTARVTRITAREVFVELPNARAASAFSARTGKQRGASMRLAESYRRRASLACTEIALSQGSEWPFAGKGKQP